MATIQYCNRCGYVIQRLTCPPKVCQAHTVERDLYRKIPSLKPVRHVFNSVTTAGCMRALEIFGLYGMTAPTHPGRMECWTGQAGHDLIHLLAHARGLAKLSLPDMAKRAHANPTMWGAFQAARALGASDDVLRDCLTQTRKI